MAVLTPVGMFTYGPGRVPPPAHLGIPGSLIAGSFPPGNIVNPMRQSKRLYIGGVNDTMTEDAILKFFNKQMQENKLAAEMKGDSVVLAQLNIEKGYAFIEVSTCATIKTLSGGFLLVLRRTSRSKE